MYTLQGKPNQHATCFPRFVHIWPLTIRISRGLRIATFHESSTVLDGYYCSREKSAPDSASQPGWVARRTHLSFSPNTANEVVGLNEESVDDRLLGLLGLYHQHVISTFNTCSWGPTHRSLTDTGGAYNLRGYDFPYHTTYLSQPTVLHFHLRALAGLRLTNQPLPTEIKREETLNLASESPHTTSTTI
jgi:hypothetical protein